MTDTVDIISEVKSRFDFTQSKIYLKEKYTNTLLIAQQGGMWNITPEFISTLNNYPEDNIILIDTYDNPIYVNRHELLKVAINTYSTVMNKWLNEFNELKKNR